MSRRDPLVKVCDNIINEVVKESTTQLVHSAVDEMVVGHMAVVRSGDWLEDFILETIQPMLPRVVRLRFLIYCVSLHYIYLSIHHD